MVYTINWKSRPGIYGVTLKPETLKTWALSRHVCSQLMVELAKMRSDRDDDRFLKTHKEKSAPRMRSTKKDGEGIKRKIAMCIHPLDPDGHQSSLLTSSVDVDKTKNIAEDQVVEFEMSIPQWYLNTIYNKKRPWLWRERESKLALKHDDTKLIFSRVMEIQATSRNVNFKNILPYDSEEMIIWKSKADLKRKTRVKVSVRNSE